MTGQPTDAADPNAPRDSSGQPGGPPPHHDIRNLRRSSTDRVIGGVCGGLGQYTGVDPVVFRIVFGVLAVFGGAGLVLYAIGWLVVPDDTATESEAQRLLRGRGALPALFAIGAAIIGILVVGDLLRRGWPGPLPAVIIIAALVAVIVYRREWIRPGGSQPLRPAPSPGAAPASDPLGPPAGFAPSRPASEQATPYGSAPYSSVPYGSVPYAPPSYAPPSYAPPFYQPPRPARAPSVLAPIGICLDLVVTGILLALGASHAISVTAQAVFAAALLTVGLALFVGTWIGRGRGLIAVGVALTICLIITAALDIPLRGGIADRVDAPTAVADLHAGYHVGIGRESLDLQSIPLDGAAHHVDVTVGIGELVVTAPTTAKVVVHATVGTGQIRWPSGDEVNGSRLDREIVLPASGPQTGEIDLNVHVGAGTIEIDRSLQGVQQ
jgi:phage shock protein PspC (stress-responsive transcriptional regulator)